MKGDRSEAMFVHFAGRKKDLYLAVTLKKSFKLIDNRFKLPWFFPDFENLRGPI